MLTVIVIGVVYGCIYALAASGLVVTYQTSGIFNFAHGAIGMIAAWTYWQFAVSWGWPTAIALIVLLFVVAPLFGLLIERVLMRPMRGASVDVTVVVTLGLLLSLVGIAYLIWPQNRIYRKPTFFPGATLKVFGFVMNGNQISVIVVAVAVAIALRLFFSRTRIGIAMRGVVDNPDLVAMAGGKPERIQQLSWAMGTSLAALAGVLLAANEDLTVLQLTLLVTLGYAAAMLGQLRSLPLTVIGGLLLGLLGSFSARYLNYSWFSGAKLILPMIMLFLVLIALAFFGRARLRVGTLIGQRAPNPASLGSSLVWSVVLVVGAVIVSGHVAPATMNILTQGLAIAFILLSLVLLTGYAGLTSLCQLTFAGLGGFAMGRYGHGGSLWGVLAAIGFAAAAGFVLGLPTLRLRGLYLALATFAFANAMDAVFFLNPKIFGLGGSINVERPHIPGIRQTDRIFFIELAVVFALTSVAVLAVRRGRFGRRLAALDDSPAACATLGLNINWTRLALFTISAGMAGLGGVLYAGGQHSVSENDFVPLLSLVILLQLRIGGIATATGAFVGAMFFAAFQLFGLHSAALTIFGWHVNVTDLQLPLTGIAAIAISRDPQGIGGHVADVAEQLRSALARRRSTQTPTGSVDEAELAHV